MLVLLIVSWRRDSRDGHELVRGGGEGLVGQGDERAMQAVQALNPDQRVLRLQFPHRILYAVKPAAAHFGGTPR